jgi:HTH-type transcriptional regulator / antitoxin HipB
MKKQGLKTYSLDEITDRHIGNRGTPKREAFEYELRLDLLGEAIRQARLERNFTQEELGRLNGLFQKSRN